MAGTLHFSALRQRRFQDALNVPQILQSVLDLHEPLLDQRLYLVATRLSFVATVQQLFHVVERKCKVDNASVLTKQQGISIQSWPERNCFQ